MGANFEINEFLRRLLANRPFRAKGFSAACGPTGGVVIDRGGHSRGVWHFHAGNYFWIPAGYAEPSFRTADVREALTHTLDVISQT